MDRSLKDWCESRYQRVDSRLQGSSDRAHSDSGLSRRHSIGDGSSSVGTGDSSKCYRDSGAFECSSNASNSDVGVKTPSDSFPVRTPWSNGSGRHPSVTKRESPLVSEKSALSSTRCSIQSTSSGTTHRSRGSSPVNSSANLSIHSHSSGSKADSISDILDNHVDVYATNIQQYGTVRRKSRPRLETSSTAMDDNESCFGDNESVSQIPILTLPSENFGKLSSSANGAQPHHFNKSGSSSSHQRSASVYAGGHFASPQTPNSNQGSPHLHDMREDLRQFNSQYLNRNNLPKSVNTSTPNQRPSLPNEKIYPPCDFEKMKRLDSASSSAASPPNAANIPPVLPPRGLDMARSSHPSYAQVPSDDREVLQRRIKELEEHLHSITVAASQKQSNVTK